MSGTEAIWMAVLDQLDQQIAVLDAEGTILQCSAAWCAHAGTLGAHARAWMIGQRFLDVFSSPFFDSAVRRNVAAALQRAAAGAPVRVVNYSTGTTGAERWYKLSVRQFELEDARFVLLTHEDISASRRLEVDRRLSQERSAREHEWLSTIVNGVPHLIVWTDRDLVLRGCNQQYALVAGLRAPSDIVGRTIAQLPRMAQHADRYTQIDRRIIESGTPALRLRETLKVANGEDRVFMVNRMPLRLRDNSVGGILVISEDITEDERAAQKMREDEERWTLALEVNDVGVWDFDVTSKSVVGSRRWREIVNLPAIAESAELPMPVALIYADDLSRFKAAWDALLCGTVTALEAGIRLRIGDSYRYTRLRGRAVRRDSAGRALRVVGTLVDIHQATVKQMQAAHASKLESIGRLAAGIAHEINTPTQYVGDNVRFLGDAFVAVQNCMDGLASLTGGACTSIDSDEVRTRLAEADMPYLREELPKAVAQSLDGIKRIADIVSAMKEFSHPGQDRTPTDINRAIANTITVATNEWKYVARIVTDFDAGLPSVPVIPGEFNQVILNIIVNAAHAIGETSISDPSHKGTIRVATRRNAEWAEVSIADDGCGMPPEVQERIFDPFFTTKPVGKGTGQGLSIAHNVIVTKHRGTISVSSEPGQGTTFTIRVPLKVEELAENAA
jgi:two-component system, NtrC family, sensor kinase